MIRKSNYNSLIFLTVLVTIVIISSFIFIESYFNSKIEEARIEQYQKQQLQISIQASSAIKDFLEYVKGELFSFGVSSQPDENYKIEKKFLSSYYSSLVDSIVSVVKTNEQGSVVKSSEDYLEYDYKRFVKDNFLGLEQFNKDYFVSQVMIEDKIYLLIAVPIYEKSRYSSGIDAELAGVVIAAIDTNLVEELYLSQISTGFTSSIILLDNSGMMLSSPKSWMALEKGDDYFEWVKTTYPGNTDNINMIIAEKTGSVKNIWNQGQHTIASYSYSFFSAGYGWIFIVETPEDEIKEGIIQLQQKMLYFLIASIVCYSIFFIIILLVLRSKEKTEMQLQKAEVTLEKLGIKANLEVHSKEKADISLKGNHIYLVQEKNSDDSLKFFSGLLNNYLGLIISRNSLDYIKKAFGIENTPIIKLGTENRSGSSPSISECKDILSIVSDFMKKSEKAAIYIDRLDYIISVNGFKNTMKLIYDLKDAMEDDSVIVLSLNPNSISQNQLSVIFEEVQDITNIVFKGEKRISKELYEILSYISRQNSENKKVVFKDISKEFKITKPTTKKKIIELSKQGLIEIEEFGREKSLILTSKGKDMIKKN